MHPLTEWRQSAARRVHAPSVPFEIDNRRKEIEMFAVLRVNTFDPDKLWASEDLIAEFDRIHAAQPGYVGSVVVDLGRGRRFALNLWDSIEHSQAALSVLGPEVNRLLGPLMAAPSEFIGAGEVIASDLARQD
jgi:hypothetical protein